MKILIGRMNDVFRNGKGENEDSRKKYHCLVLVLFLVSVLKSSNKIKFVFKRWIIVCIIFFAVDIHIIFHDYLCC